MFLNNLNFFKLKFFIIFSEFFIGIMLIYVLVVFVLLISNIYGLLIEKIISEIIGFILLFSCFLILNDKIKLNWNLYQPVFFWVNKFISFSLFSKIAKFMVCMFLVIFFFLISDFLKIYKLTSFEYLILLGFATLGLILLCSANDFITVFLSIELISLCSYFIASFRKFSSYSLQSGIKYLIVGAISSGFFLLGSSFLYAYTGSVCFIDIKFLLADPSKIILFSSPMFFFEPNFFVEKFYWFNYLKLFNKNSLVFYKSYKFFVEIGIIFLLFSIFIKLALAPFHLWSLDVYEGSPSISTFFFSTFTKLSFFVFLSRLCFLFNVYYGNFWLFFNFLIGFLSVLFGSFGGIKQKKIKTLLAYSSISHMGYALLAFSSFFNFGFEMLYFYLFTYVLSNIIIWYVILSLHKIQKIYTVNLTKNLNDFVLLYKSNKILSFCLSLAFFSLAGIPPLLGFMAKLNIFLILIKQQFYISCLFIVICSVVSTFYYVRLIKILYFENVLVGQLYNFKSNNVLIFCFFTFSLIFLFFNPTLFYLFVHKMLLFENSKNIVDIFEFNQTNQNLYSFFEIKNTELVSKLVFIY